MAYQGASSMSPPAQKPSPLPYSPYPASGSPPNGSPFAPPPAKRPRLSPDARSPPNGNMSYSAPAVGAFTQSYSQSPVQSPYGTPNFAGSPLGSFNTPQPYQPQHIQWQAQPATPSGRSGSPPNPSQSSQMPPPPRPNKEEKDERITADDFGDSLFGSGINLKDEENYMHSTFSNRHHESFATQNSSFGSSTFSPNNSFNLLTQGTSVSSQGQDGPFAGTLGAPLSQDEIEAQERQKRQAAAATRSESLQHHLRNQFLNGNAVRRRLDKVARDEGILLPTRGLYVRTDADRAETRVAVNGDEQEGIVAVKPESMVEQGSQFDHLLSLVSLAAGERLRGLVDESYALSRARRYGDHGRVPPEFADIAAGEGKKQDEQLVPENITGTQWDRIPDQANPAQNGEGPNGVSKSATPQPLPTVSFQDRVNARLRDIAARDKQAEKERIKRREARKRKAEDAAANADDAAETSAPDTPIAEAPKMTKKEMQKQQKAASAAAESESHSTTNQTAAMMALGKKGNRYSWMSGGAAAMPTNRYKAPTGSGASTPGVGKANISGGTAMSRVGSGAGEKELAWGDFREEGPAGQGIQARDLALVLERDGREKKALQRVWNKLGAMKMGSSN